MDKTQNFELIANDVIVVGELRDPKDQIQIDTNLQGDELITAILKKYKFIRESKMNEAAKTAGLPGGKFFHIRMVYAGVETIVLPNGEKRRRSSRTTKVGFNILFERTRAKTFNEIKGEIISKNFKPLAGDPNSGQIVLTEYVLIGKWDVFPLGFKFHPHQIDPKDGILKPLMATRRLDNGTYKKEEAVDNMGRQFIFEDEVDILETLRDNIRSRVEKWKITAPDNNVGESAGAGVNIDETKEPEFAKSESPADDEI